MNAATVQMHDVVLMAHHFGVSRQVVLYRLRNLRILSDRELRELLDQEQAGRGRQLEKLLDLAEPEHEKERNRFRHRFLGLALEAHRRGAIGREELEHIFALLLDAPEVRTALIECGITPVTGGAEAKRTGQGNPDRIDSLRDGG